MRYYDKKNQMSQAWGTLNAINATLEQVIEQSEKNNQRLEQIMQTLVEKGNDQLTLVELTDLDVILNDEMFDENIDILMNYIVNLKEVARFINALGINLGGRSLPEANVVSYKLHTVLRNVAAQLIDAVINYNGQDKIMSVLLNAAANIASERMNHRAFLEEFNLIVEGEDPDQIADNYSDAYNEWLMKAAGEIVAESSKNPFKPIMIHPYGLKEVKAAIKEAFPVGTDLSSLGDVDNLTFEDMLGENFMKKLGDVIRGLNVDIDSAQEIAGRIMPAIRNMYEMNVVGELPGGIDGGTKPVLSATNLPEIIAQALIIGGNDVIAKGDLDENTQTILEMIGDELDKIEVEYDTETPCRLLSLVAGTVPLIIASNIMLKSQNMEYLTLTQNLNVIAAEVLGINLHDEEKGEEDGNKQ